MKKLIILPALLFFLFSLPVYGEEASVQLGEKLFNDPTLGGSANPESCNSCHPRGRGLESSGKVAGLAEMINLCIEKPLRGKKIDEDSVEMKSLVLYIKSLAQ